MRQHTVQTPYMVGEVHFYSTELNGGLAIFDTGPPTAEGMDRLREEIDLARLRYVFITHCHVDHYGLVAHIEENSDAEIFIPRMDDVKLRCQAERTAHIQGLLDGCGFDGSFYLRLKDALAKNNVFPTLPQRYRIVEESAEYLAGLGIGYLSCPGHSQSDIVYLCNGYAVTGDILLRNIFQAPLLDIDLQTFAGRYRNYDAYCRSIVELARARGLTILPGHRGHVSSLDDTILFYVRKVMERAGRLLEFPRSISVSRIIERLFPEGADDPFVVYLKASEVVFMRDFLDEPQRLRASMESIGLFGEVADLYGRVAGRM